ncbi:unnamed protein product [Protopolystoma xenopodis]|uniref:Uncharacterized protein n=1 Tax=Protopolystoma xenopodis TaxID=117903 RepID=A0A3S5CP10_9PLAT|nr:unnamed protein product [Protopolystoma xenopodis]
MGSCFLHNELNLLDLLLQPLPCSSFIAASCAQTQSSTSFEDPNHTYNGAHTDDQTRRSQKRTSDRAEATPDMNEFNLNPDLRLDSALGTATDLGSGVGGKRNHSTAFLSTETEAWPNKLAEPNIRLMTDDNNSGHLPSCLASEIWSYPERRLPAGFDSASLIVSKAGVSERPVCEATIALRSSAISSTSATPSTSPPTASNRSNSFNDQINIAPVSTAPLSVTSPPTHSSLSLSSIFSLSSTNASQISFGDAVSNLSSTGFTKSTGNKLEELVSSGPSSTFEDAWASLIPLVRGIQEAWRHLPLRGSAQVDRLRAGTVWSIGRLTTTDSFGSAIRIKNKLHTFITSAAAFR